jgi:hypothetical protein
MEQEVEAKLVEVPREIAALQAAVRRFEWERGCRVLGVLVREKDYSAVKWMVVLAEMGVEVTREAGVREGYMVLCN